MILQTCLKRDLQLEPKPWCLISLKTVFVLSKRAAKPTINSEISLLPTLTFYVVLVCRVAAFLLGLQANSSKWRTLSNNTCGHTQNHEVNIVSFAAWRSSWHLFSVSLNLAEFAQPRRADEWKHCQLITHWCSVSWAQISVPGQVNLGDLPSITHWAKEQKVCCAV